VVNLAIVIKSIISYYNGDIMRKKEKSIKLAKIRYYLRQASKWHNVDNGMPNFYTSEDYKRAKIVKSPVMCDYPYYCKSDIAISNIAEKIYELMKE